MDSWEPRFTIYIILLLANCIYCWAQWPILKKADRWICFLLTLTVIQESLAGYLTIIFKSNFITYHIYTPIELILICVYFDLSLKILKPYRLALIIGIPATLTSVLISIFFQHYNKYNSYFLLIEGIIVITLCLVAFYMLLIREDVVPKRMVHFWLTLAFLLYWSLTYVSLGLFSGEAQNIDFVAKIIAWALYISNLLFYLGLLTIFIFYKRLLPSGE